MNRVIGRMVVVRDHIVALGFGLCTFFGGLTAGHIAEGGVIIIDPGNPETNGGYRGVQIAPRAQGDAIFWFRYENSAGPSYHRLGCLDEAGFDDDFYNSSNALSGFVVLTNGSVAVADDATGLRRLTPEGPDDPGYTPPHLADGPFSVRALAGYLDGRLLVSGAEQALDGQSNTILIPNTFRIETNGVIDTSYTPEPLQENVWARQIHIRRNSRVLASIEGPLFPGPELVALRPGGVRDTSFQMENTLRHTIVVSRIIERADSRLLIAGQDLSTTGAVVVCVHTNGNLYLSFGNGGILRPGSPRVLDIALAANDGFYAVLDEPRPSNNVHRFSATGTPDPSFAVTLNDNALCVGVGETNSVWIGGYFTRVDNVSHPYAAKLNLSGRLFPPTRAEGLAATAVTAWKANLRWDASPRATQYFLERSTNGIDGWIPVHTIASDGTRGPVEEPGHIIFPPYPYTIDGRREFSVVDAPLIGLDEVFYRVGVSNQTGPGPFSEPVRVVVPQYTATWEIDPGFSAQTGGDGSIFCLSLMENGGVVAGGNFGIFGDLTTNSLGSPVFASSACSNLARVLPNGARDSSFMPPIWNSGEVHSVLSCTGEQILAGGTFSATSRQTNAVGTGVTAYHFALLETNGVVSPDTLPPFQSLAPGVNAMARQQDGKIVVAGGFPQPNVTGPGGEALIPAGVARMEWTVSTNIVISFPPHGPATTTITVIAGWTFDTTFSGGCGVSGVVNAAALEADGDVLIGGVFDSVHGQSCSNLARLHPDGSLDTTFAGSADGSVNALVALPDGAILVGGAFARVGDQPAPALARLLTDGSRDAAFASPPETNAIVHVILPEPDGGMFVGGNFQQWAGNARGCLIRLQADGSEDAAFDVGTGVSAGEVRALAKDGSGHLLVAGDFASFNGIARNDLVRLAANPLSGPPCAPEEFFVGPWRGPSLTSHLRGDWSPVELGIGPRGYVIQGSADGIGGWVTVVLAEGDVRYAEILSEDCWPSFFRIAAFNARGVSEWSPAIPVPASLFEQWKCMWGVDGEWGPDGEPLALHYALGATPFERNVGRLPHLDFDNGQMEFSFPMVRREVNYIVESSTNLVDWTQVFSSNGSGNPEETVIAIGTPAEPSKFWRLRTLVPDCPPGLPDFFGPR
ncbi:MAG TPA: hypothetical protein PLU30_12365 [Verrucomicrobiae bacterium]|nr:hypothetical protein [Verrucomicrobiae bacterium]